MRNITDRFLRQFSRDYNSQSIGKVTRERRSKSLLFAQLEEVKTNLEWDRGQSQVSLYSEPRFIALDFFLHFRRVNSARWKMGVAFKRQKFPKTARLTDLMCKCQSKLQMWETWARSTARERILETTNVFLFTISSSHYYEQVCGAHESDAQKTGIFPAGSKSSAGRRTDRIPLDLAIIDEAGATLESHIPVILKMQPEHLMLLGDVKQLRPLVKGDDENEIRAKKVDRSCMERCIDAGVGPKMLEIQYRMPERIGRLVSKLFYEGALKTAAEKMSELETLYAPHEQLRWVNCPTKEDKIGKSTVNSGQTVKVLALLEQDDVLQNALINHESVKIISMYKPQHRLLEKFVKSLFPRDFGAGLIQVCTVDAAQGSEADHIVLVTTRCNPSCNIGFLENKNRC